MDRIIPTSALSATAPSTAIKKLRRKIGPPAGVIHSVYGWLQVQAGQ
jgi:hypothetical protein